MNKAIEIVTSLSDQLWKLNKEELELLSTTLTRRDVRKGEILLDEGEIAKHIYWVQQGMLRQFYYKDGRDVTEHFACDGQGALCITSIFTQTRSKLLVEALEDGVVYLMSYLEFKRLAETNTAIAMLLCKILESSLILSQEKADSWRYETARERYERFIREYPDASKRASVNHISSYLLMTPETLSRIRASVI